ncbi:(2Fe-2S)-binding protein [Actibacterium sp. 188UL27-1]|uniref:(2Fe-2S)-binding protein n=1 Tax=Actibacterium sp. 188UL27-1 TaxID=2786961 RepID=UPI00195EE875|nr:(2Fe-2S)-binding protein [Actibacterium sp. 188UL27-1]MBM7066142.1 (2Fe-2S)-binding protein [Actibacterium sp. 188UL27-1]
MVTFTLNGETRQVDVEPDMPLLWVLRDELKMTGTKFGCGVAACGACTVHLNGEPVRSCQTWIEDVEGAEVTTIEGVDNKAAQAIQAAWVELQVPQCGYCQSGQIMQASALLIETPKPSDDDIDAAMESNLCRCASYARIRKAIHRAADIMEA